jgi:putative endonuclease
MPSSESEHSHCSARQVRGKHFEDQAASFYEAQGYTVVERNWRAGHKEIDLIVRNDNALVFVEVKASTTDQFGHPSERVDKTKVRHLTNAAQQYVLEKKIEGCDLRFDVITFFEGKLEHYPNAFGAEIGDI